jgi:hypothetical protein
MKHGYAQLLVSPLSENASQSGRFVTFEARVTSHKKEALQPLSVPKNVAWNSLTFRGEVIDEPMNRGGDLLLNQCIHLS